MYYILVKMNHSFLILTHCSHSEVKAAKMNTLLIRMVQVGFRIVVVIVVNAATCTFCCKYLIL